MKPDRSEDGVTTDLQRQSGLTIVTPTFEKHFTQFSQLVDSIVQFCVDKPLIELIAVVEAKNRIAVQEILAARPSVRSRIVTTERVLDMLMIEETPQTLLQTGGKFSFQSLKKIGGILHADTDWVLVLDSESNFLKPFSANELVRSYASKKYIFYSNISQRGPGWAGSLSEAVTANASLLVGGTSDRWFMEYYHWFYETRLWRRLIDHLRESGGMDLWLSHVLPRGVFENVLYYQYVAANGPFGYQFVDIVEAMNEHIPPAICARISSALMGRLQLVGLAEHLLSLVSIAEVADLQPLFDAYDLPFLRLEPYTIDPALLTAVTLLPSVRALTSSHRLGVMRKRVAICVAGEFRSVFANIQSLRHFTTGVTCDVFVHMWHDETVPAVKDALQPYLLVTEYRPDVEDVIDTIARPEPLSKENRDAGSLYMFYGIQRSIELLKDRADTYDYVVRLRPDTVYQQTLRELIFDISNDEDAVDNGIYVPAGFHSQGINDQFAIGKTSAMLRYSRIFDYAVENAPSEYFNPEHMMACHILDAGLAIKTLPMHYLLLRKEPANLDWVGRLQHIQDTTWWSAPLPGPWKIRLATQFFATKRAAVDDMTTNDRYEGSEVVVSTEFLSVESRHHVTGPLVRMIVVRDYKNPDCLLLVRDEHGHATWFISIEANQLHLVRDRPAGIAFAIVSDDGREIDVVRYLDELDEPLARLTIPCYLPAPGQVERQTIDVLDHAVPGVARGRQAPDDGPMSNEAADQALGKIEHGKPTVHDRLLVHMLMSKDETRAGGWRRLQARLLLRKARRARRSGDLVAAERLYAKVLLIQPRRAREWVQYGHALKDQHHWSAAADAYRLAIRLEPDNPEPGVHLENVLSQPG